ncbi:MAG: DUF2892 domain-containing protein [Archangium sp.]|nr:DUF2892 domain-containing protein [Archangium sp.]
MAGVPDKDRCRCGRGEVRKPGPSASSPGSNAGANLSNIGPVDRGLRVVAGVGLTSLALSGQTPWGWLGLIPLITALVGFCPLYRLLGLSTLRRA